MRRVGIVLAMVFACFGMSAPAAAQTSTSDAALEACVAAAGASRAALEGCKSAVSEPCIETPGGETTAGMVRCFDAEARAWTSVMDAALQRASANATRTSHLTAAQQAWTAWREAECRYEASLYEGGSLARAQSSACYANLTADRAIMLLYAERTYEM